MSRPKTVMVDLDGVICTEEMFHDRPLAEPIAGAREALRKLRAAGHIVVIYTARGWGEFRVTEKWLADHGIEYDGLHMGKPVANLWIDDRAVGFADWDATLAEVERRIGLKNGE
jgi:trehalose-6-phosphatase